MHLRTLPKYLILISLLAGPAGVQAAAAVEQAKPMISYTSLDPAHVQGSLGLALGKLMTVEGLVQTGDPHSKADADKILLRVDKVNGQPLAKPVSLPMHFFDFTGLTQPKPGSHVKYQGYESGSFEGIPSESFKVMPAVASQGLHFELFFQVCKQEK